MYEPGEEHEARVMCGDPVACAYQWIQGYVKILNDAVTQSYDYEEYGGGDSVTFEELIETGMSHVRDSKWGGDYITRGGAFEGMGTDPVFWDKLALLMDIEIPHSKRNSFFSCSC